MLDAVHRYQNRDASALRKFRGNRVKDASSKKMLLMTDINELDQLANAGIFSFENIYAKSA